MTNIEELILKCYNLYIQKYSKAFSGDWTPVYGLVKDLLTIKGINDILISQPTIKSFIDVENDKFPYRDYGIKIVTAFGNIIGFIRCISTENDSIEFGKYSIVIYLQDASKLYESVNCGFLISQKDMDPRIIKSLIDKVRNACDLGELKKVIRTMILNGLSAAFIMSVVMFTVDLKLTLQEIILEYAFRTEMRARHDLEEDNILVINPEWELLNNNTLTTVYNAFESLCNDDVSHTASGFLLDLKKPGSHKIIAMERTMMKEYGLKYGDLIKIEGTDGYDGVYLLQDTMNKRFKGLHKIDILVDNDIHLGQWENVSIYKLANQKDCIKLLKRGMKDSLNQARMDARQYPGVFESYTGLILDDDVLDAEEGTLIKHKDIDILKSAEIELEVDLAVEILKLFFADKPNDKINVDINTFDQFIPATNITIGSAGRPISHACIESDIAPEDFNIIEKAKNRYTVVDVYYHAFPPKFYEDGNSLQYTTEQVLTAKADNPFYRLIFDKLKLESRLHIHSAWLNTKWINIHPLIIDLVSSLKKFKLIEITWECVSYKTVAISLLNMPIDDMFDCEKIMKISLEVHNYPHKMIVNCTETISFFRGKNSKGESLYLPKVFKEGDTLDSNLKLPLLFIDKFPTEVNVISATTMKSSIITLMFRTKENMIKILSPFIKNGFSFVDEYKNEYNTIEDLNNAPFKSIDDAIKSNNEKVIRISNKLKELIGGKTFDMFNSIIDKKLYKHFYVNILYKFNRKQANIYKKFDNNVIIKFLEDNGVSSVIKEKQNILYFYYALLNRIKVDNPNGWQKDKDPNITLKKIYDNDYARYDAGRWFDMKDVPMALDDTTLLYYFIYTLGKVATILKNTAIINIEDDNNDLRDIYQQMLLKLSLDITYKIDKIDFSAVAECFNTIFYDILTK